MFHQTFEPRDLLLVVMLVILEGLLSIDNALVLGLLARQLPEKSQRKALTYGLIGSFIFRVIAIALAAYLLKWRWVKLLGGLYLIYVAVRHFFQSEDAPEPTTQATQHRARKFWSVVVAIEFTDVAFAADSILASIAMVGPAPKDSAIHPKFWLILLGGMMGVLLMRVAAVAFIRLLKRFPRFETTAYLLVSTVGLKLIADWWYNAETERLNFQSPQSPAFWVFWLAMMLCIAIGFLPGRKPAV
jgi:YkoY family integral membrane protein